MADPIDVSQEELRFLRRSFRRFALPYLAAGLVVAVAGVVFAPARAPVEDSNEPAVQGLIAESASLREAIAALREELAASEARDGEHSGRIEQLDRRVGRLADEVENVSSGAADGALEARLDEAHRRLHALEARVANAERQRRNAVTLESGGAQAPPASATDPLDGSPGLR